MHRSQLRRCGEPWIAIFLADGGVGKIDPHRLRACGGGAAWGRCGQFTCPASTPACRTGRWNTWPGRRRLRPRDGSYKDLQIDEAEGGGGGRGIHNTCYIHTYLQHHWGGPCRTTEDIPPRSRWRKAIFDSTAGVRPPIRNCDRRGVLKQAPPVRLGQQRACGIIKTFTPCDTQW